MAAATQRDNSDIGLGKRKPLTAADRLKEAYRLDPLDQKICEVLFEHPEATIRETAALADTTRAVVERRLKKPAVRKRLEDMRRGVTDLIRRGQVMGIRRLMQLMRSSDEYVALQACKIVMQPLLNTANLNVDMSQRMVYEVQVGPQGQVFQTMRPLDDPSANPQNFPNTMDLVLQAGLAQAPNGEHPGEAIDE